MTDHEKRIREFLSERGTMRGLCPEQVAGANDSRLNAPDLRALLADLDAMRGALELYLAHAPEPECAIWRHVQQKARAALKGADSTQAKGEANEH